MEIMMIKDAAKRLNVEAHVLRYWEDELGLEIKRNQMGHRYYDERDIKLFNMVKELKEMGHSLKDIRLAIMKQKKILEMKEEKNVPLAENTDSDTPEAGHTNANREMTEEYHLQDEKGTEIKRIERNGNDEGHEVLKTSEGTQSVHKDDADVKIVDFKQAQLQAVMNKVVANALRENKDIITSSIKEEITSDVMRQFDTVMREREEREEERFKKLDEYMRMMQQTNAEVAATKQKGIFRRRK